MMTTLQLGADHKPVELIIDTGSHAFWINRADCGNDNNGLAKDCELAQKDRYLGYLDGTASGKLAHTDVLFEESGIVSKNHPMIVIKEKTELMTYGIIGMADGFMEETNFLTKLKENEVISKKAFGIFKDESVFELILGGVDRSLVKENAREIKLPILNSGSFFINIERANIGETQIVDKDTETLIDSGNTLISIPGYLSDLVMEALKNRGMNCEQIEEQNKRFNILGCYYEKETTPSFVDMTFTIQGVTFTIPGEQLISTCTNEMEEPTSAYENDDDDKVGCFLNIEFYKQGSHFTLGKAFINHVYTTFDLEANEITFIQNPK